MTLICEHCDQMIVGNTYRVTSEEDGYILLEMIVCSVCAMEAKQLHLRTEVVDAASRVPASTSCDSLSEIVGRRR
ncbi:MAG: hypothetical protein ACM3TN_21010 [Alphaproteobacteria bacterium]